MSIGMTLTFYLPEGWTLRKVAAALVREWLPPFRSEPAVKSARWVVQSVVEDPGKTKAPLWEPGISTREYEERVERADLDWAIRASAGRGRHTILARLVMNKEQPETFRVVSYPDSFPETLFDAGKLDQLLNVPGRVATQDLFAALLTSKGFELATI